MQLFYLIIVRINSHNTQPLLVLRGSLLLLIYHVLSIHIGLANYLLILKLNRGLILHVTSVWVLMRTYLPPGFIATLLLNSKNVLNFKNLIAPSEGVANEHLVSKF